MGHSAWDGAVGVFLPLETLSGRWAVTTDHAAAGPAPQARGQYNMSGLHCTRVGSPDMRCSREYWTDVSKPTHRAGGNRTGGGLRRPSGQRLSAPDRGGL